VGVKLHLRHKQANKRTDKQTKGANRQMDRRQESNFGAFQP